MVDEPEDVMDPVDEDMSDPVDEDMMERQGCGDENAAVGESESHGQGGKGGGSGEKSHPYLSPISLLS